MFAGSPVPTQTISAFEGATATAPVEAEPSLAKTFRNVVPWFVVFHRPPPAVVRYNVFGSDSTPVTVYARPAGIEGPRSLHSSVAVCSGSSIWAWRPTGLRTASARAARSVFMARLLRSPGQGRQNRSARGRSIRTRRIPIPSRTKRGRGRLHPRPRPCRDAVEVRRRPDLVPRLRASSPSRGPESRRLRPRFPTRVRSEPSAGWIRTPAPRR